MKTFRATFSSRDQPALLRAVIRVAAYARDVPHRMFVNHRACAPTADWAEQAIMYVDQVTAKWGPGEVITWSPGGITAGFPDVPFDPVPLVHLMARLPFERATMPSICAWTTLGYTPPDSLGWAMAFKGAGHERFLVSRRWLEHGPWRLVRGPEDSTIIQFHETFVEPETAISQASPAHAALAAGSVAFDPVYGLDHGTYSREERMMRFDAGSKVTLDGMTEACMLRRDEREDPEAPIEKIAFVFRDPNAAQRHLHELWLRELECRIVEDGVERRLDVDYAPSPSIPEWVLRAGAPAGAAPAG